MKLRDLEKELIKRLDMERFSFDLSLNGIQVDAHEGKEIRRVALAVDACQRTIKEAASRGADLLFVHHGLFWGRPLAIRGAHYQRVKELLDHDMALFACHLPLDAHLEYGNNAQMAHALGIQDPEPFCLYKGCFIGAKGTLPRSMSAEEICSSLGFAPEHGLRTLLFGRKDIRTIAFVSGSGEDEIPEAMAEGVDCYVTGEIGHVSYHTCLEAGFNVIAGGHYQSEVFGVKAVGRMLEEELGLETFFLEAGTDL